MFNSSARRYRLVRVIDSHLERIPCTDDGILSDARTERKSYEPLWYHEIVLVQHIVLIPCPNRYAITLIKKQEVCAWHFQ